MRPELSIRLGGAVLFCAALTACDGSGDLASQAEAQANTACACTDADCAATALAWFTQTMAEQAEEISSMTPERQEVFTAANARATQCQASLPAGSG